MFKTRSESSLDSLVSTFFLMVQLLLSSLVVFFSATRLHFDLSFYLFCNTLMFIVYNGKQSLDLFSSSGLLKVFFALVVVMCVSFQNYEYYELSGNKLFFFSIIWFLNFVFFYKFSLLNTNLKKSHVFSILFFIASIYSNYRAFNTFRVENAGLIQYHYFYFLLMVLPLCYIRVVKYFKYILLGITFIAIVYALKRSGILVSMLLLFFLLVTDLKKSKVNKVFVLLELYFLNISQLYCNKLYARYGG